MKKLLLMAAIAALLMSCEDESKPKELEVSKSSFSVDWGDSVLVGATSDFDITYTSENPYYLTVTDNGYIKGRHVGNGTAKVESNGETKHLGVTVESVYSLFPDPVTDFTKSKAYFKSIYGRAKVEGEASLYYVNYGYTSIGLTILFNENDIVEAAGLFYPMSKRSNMLATISERYEPLGYDESMLMFMDALAIEDASMIVAQVIDVSEGYVMAMYLPNSYASYSLKTGQLNVAERLMMARKDTVPKNEAW